MVGIGAYSIGSKMPTVRRRRPVQSKRSLHWEREDAIGRRTAIQPPASDNLKHLAASQSADRSVCRLSIHAPSPSQVVERRPGGAVSLGVAIEDEPDRQLGSGRPCRNRRRRSEARSEAEKRACWSSAWRSPSCWCSTFNLAVVVSRRGLLPHCAKSRLELPSLGWLRGFGGRC
jgi:hypothetical protein